MIKTKTKLIKEIARIGELKINQGLKFKELSLSIEGHKEEKTLKEWLNFIKPFIQGQGGFKNGRSL